MASMTGKIELSFSADGRDEETVRRFYDKLGPVIERAALQAGGLFSGVKVTFTATTPTGMTVRK